MQIVGRISSFNFIDACRAVVSLVSTVLFCMAHVSGTAWADDGHGHDCSAVRVFVRTIQATSPVKEESTSEQTARESTIDDNLSDLRPKLEQLPFTSFKLISEKEQQLSLREKDVLHLPNGQLLAFRPMYMDHKRVGLWLSWKDEGGSDILNTRIHFDSDDSVLTGTDSSQDSGLILAIKASPVPKD